MLRASTFLTGEIIPCFTYISASNSYKKTIPNLQLPNPKHPLKLHRLMAHDNTLDQSHAEHEREQTAPAVADEW